MRAGSTSRSQRFAVVLGCISFFIVGVALLPGLISQSSTPPPEPMEIAHVASVQAPPVARHAPVEYAAAGRTPPISQFGASPDTFDCMISANELVEIGSSIRGSIESILVERSQYVEAGQVLATLESSVEQAAVRVAKARADRSAELDSTRVSLELGKKRRQRAANLYEGRSLSLDLREEIDTETQLAELGVAQAEENHRLATLELEQARAALERRTITSPFAGFVVERMMSTGEVVDEETILVLAQVDPLRVEVILPTYLFGSVEVGDAVEIVPEAPLDQARTAQVAIVDRMLDGASGTFGVRLLLPNPDRGLPGGLRCRARLIEEGEAHAAAAPGAEAPSS